MKRCLCACVGIKFLERVETAVLKYAEQSWAGDNTAIIHLVFKTRFVFNSKLSNVAMDSK